MKICLDQVVKLVTYQENTDHSTCFARSLFHFTPLHSLAPLAPLAMLASDQYCFDDYTNSKSFPGGFGLIDNVKSVEEFNCKEETIKAIFTRDYIVFSKDNEFIPAFCLFEDVGICIDHVQSMTKSSDVKLTVKHTDDTTTAYLFSKGIVEYYDRDIVSSSSRFTVHKHKEEFKPIEHNGFVFTGATLNIINCGNPIKTESKGSGFYIYGPHDLVVCFDYNLHGCPMLIGYENEVVLSKGFVQRKGCRIVSFTRENNKEYTITFHDDFVFELLCEIKGEKYYMNKDSEIPFFFLDYASQIRKLDRRYPAEVEEDNYTVRSIKFDKSCFKDGILKRPFGLENIVVVDGTVDNGFSAQVYFEGM